MMTLKEQRKPTMVACSIIAWKMACAVRDTPRNTKQALRPPLPIQCVLYRQSKDNENNMNDGEFETKNAFYLKL